MNKRVILSFLIVSLMLIGFAMAQEVNESSSSDSENFIEKAYSCLEERIEGNADISLEEAIFSTLALGFDDNLIEVIEDERDSDECWPDGNCRLKETAQVALAYDRINKDTSEIREWLIGSNGSSGDLIWFLQIDISNHVPSSCTLTYDGQERNVDIGEDMRLSGNPGSCLDVAAGGYWLRVNDNCLQKEFKISCDEDFVSSTVYQKRNGQTVFVSSNTNSASSLGTTTEMISALCFKTSGGCDYEGSLWAAMTLKKLGEDVSEFIPYLLALADENQRYLPSAFLYTITGGNDQYNELIQDQKQGKFWQQTGTLYNRFYDSSLAMLALSGDSPTEMVATQSYLEGIQTEEGCWSNNNLRDTGFVLYSGFNKNVPSSRVTNTGSSGVEVCSSPRSCEFANDCKGAGGDLIYDLSCPGISVCCSQVVEKLSCAEQSGSLCSAGESCSGNEVSSSSGTCCLGSCVENTRQDTCESFGIGSCKFSCSSDEEERTSASCKDNGDICCVTNLDSEEGGAFTFWIITLLALIVVVILLIIFRKKLQLWWHMRKGRQAGAGPGGRPGGPGGLMYGGLLRRGNPTGLPPGRPLQGRPPMRRPGPAGPMDATMQKLKDMSK